MGNLGIGLGGFGAGLEKGYGIGSRIKQDRDAEEAKENDKRAMAEGTMDMQAAVTRGEVDPNDAAASIRFVAPRMMLSAMQNRDPAALKQWSDFSKSADANAGARLFESGMRRITVGDTEGGWADFQKLGKLKGYGGDYEIGPLQKGEDGQFTTTIKTADGRTLTPKFQDAAAFVARFGNPGVAFEDMRSAQKRKEAIDDDATKYGARKKIDIEAAPQQNATFLERYEGQKNADIAAEQKKQQLGLGPSNFEVVNRSEQDENGKPVVRSYKFDKRKGTMERVEGDGEITKPGRGGSGSGGRKPFQFEVVRDAYVKLGYSEQDATDIATGRKPPRDTELLNVARQMTNMEMPASDMRYKAKQRKERYEEILTTLRTQYRSGPRASSPDQAPGIGGPQPRSDAPPSGGDPVRPAVAGTPAPRNPGDRKVGNVYTAPDGRNVKWTGKGWLVVP